ncbi:cell wall hydrolase [Halanaerobium sp. Z-7514]|uniref:Cell wall hydrolase n=1 Tax=Halanaerobium polyolivorans TaxID=2886943 RepID=A0AAW4WY43_9FIRM|nr:cell wall hydrolase [Halanaerobium polyolivorans]MCC3143899.1 cell wall hydrolase [Halanaerobium polyolivorans]RQD68629.1 MAG: cell wall hydrolase [Halanaerobium sp. MSAO_Bac5]
MQNISFKKIIIALSLILIINSIFIPVLYPVNRVRASSSIDREDLYTGLGLVFLLVVFGGSRDRNTSSSDFNINRDDIESRGSFDEEEVHVLASIIHAEARGESYKGKVAVGAVVLNRVYDPAFPDTIKEVVYQSGQFTPVENDMINMAPNDESIKAAYEAIEGNDPSQGSLYFYNPDKSINPSFFAQREKVIRIGNHVFLR